MSNIPNHMLSSRCAHAALSFLSFSLDFAIYYLLCFVKLLCISITSNTYIHYIFHTIQNTGTSTSIRTHLIFITVASHHPINTTILGTDWYSDLRHLGTKTFNKFTHMHTPFHIHISTSKPDHIGL